LVADAASVGALVIKLATVGAESVLVSGRFADHSQTTATVASAEVVAGKYRSR